MKLSLTQLKPGHRSESGSAVLVMLAFLVLIVILCAETARVVISSRREVSLIEQRQVARLAAVTTNAPPAAKPMGTQ